MAVIFALWMRNLKAFWRNKPALIFNIAFPLFFIFVFGELFRNDYMDNHVPFMLAGIIIAIVFDSAIRVSTSTIDDITSGFMKEVLVSPVSRLSVAAGQFLSSATVAAAQGFMVFVVGFAIGLRIGSPLTVLWAILAMAFVGVVFAGFGLFIATRAKNIQTFQAVSLAITMPMTFLSGAYIPLSMLNDFLTHVAYFNPVTYAVNFFRAIVLENMGAAPEVLAVYELSISFPHLGDGFVITPWMSGLVLLVFGVLFLVLSTISFVRTDFSKLNRNKKDSMEIDW
jgi:ABC-2 type transport system permease protein